MFYGLFGTQNSMVTFISKFDQTKGELQVKLGQFRSNFKIRNIVTKVCLSCAVLSQNPKKCHLFLCTAIRNAKK